MTAIASVMAPRTARVIRVQPELRDVFTVHLAVDDAPGGFAFAPGQFNMLYVFGVGEVPISVSGDAARRDALVHTVRSVGPVTQAMWRAAERGEALGVRGPFGSAWPVEQARGRDLIVMAGGLGLAPLRPVIYQVLRERARYGRVSLLYGTRAPDDVLFRDELDAWRKAGDIDVLVTVDHAPRHWTGHVGVVTELLKFATFDPANTVAMVCGPEVMMRFGARDLLHRGVPEPSVYVSLERSMKCGVGLCGHCQMLSTFVCKNGPVYRHDEVVTMLGHREI